MKNKELYSKLENYISDNRWPDMKIIDELSKTKKFKKKIFTYGSTPYETAKLLFSKIEKKPKRLVVVGASIGWMSFYWNELNPNIPTLGIDLHKGRIDFGNSLIQEYKLKNIDLKVGDVYKFKFQEGDLIWMSNLCFDETDNNKLVNNIINNHPNIPIISYKIIHIKKEYVSEYKLPVSWMKNGMKFFIYDNSKKIKL